MKKMLMMAILMMMMASTARADEVKAIGRVVEVDTIEWVMTVETEDGNLWELEVDDEWNVGDLVMMTFEDFDNEDVKDDEVIEIDYLTRKV